MNVKESSICIGGRKIDRDSPCFVIAEAGVNHDGDVAVAENLVREAKKAGADCVKFQTFTPSDLVKRQAPKAAYQLENTDRAESQLAMLEKLRLPAEAYPKLKRLCSCLDILFLSTPYTFRDVDFLDSIGVDAFKIASAQLVEPIFLQYVAAKGKPVILSTGMGTMEEVAAAMRAIRSVGNRRIILLQCTTNYPARDGDANLRAMSSMGAAFGCLVGYSDHTRSDTTALGAVALGARVIEKHFTVDKSLPGPDHSSSCDPLELKQLVDRIRTLEAALGDGVKRPSEGEMRNASAMRRSLVSARLIRSGERLTPDVVALKRPATGILAAEWDLAMGRKVLRDVEPDTVLTWDVLDA